MGCKKVFYYFLISMLFLFISQIYADDWNPPETYTLVMPNINHNYEIYINDSEYNSCSYGIIKYRSSTNFGLDWGDDTFDIYKKKNNDTIILNVSSKKGVNVTIKFIDLTNNTILQVINYPSSNVGSTTNNTTTNTGGNTKAPIPFEVVILVLIAIPLISLKKFK